MQSNQRARLVLGPLGLILVLVTAGLVTGIGIALLHRRPSANDVARNAPTHTSTSGIVLSSDRLDFGEIVLDRAVARQLLLRNTGSEAVQVRLEGSGDAFVVSPRSLTLEPGRVSRVTVTANPKKPGSLKDELRVFADGSSKAPLVVVLEGRARDTGVLGLASVDAGSAGGGPAAGAGSRADASTTPLTGDAETATQTGDAPPAGSVQITRSSTSAVSDLAGDGDASGTRAGGSHAPGMVVVPVARSMSDRPNVPSPDEPPRAGEEPAPVGSKKPVLDKKPKDPAEPPPSAPTFAVLQTSTLSLLGSLNSFYPQQVGVLGSATGGSFSLTSALQLPRVPLAFGQSMLFNQAGAAGGEFDASSGQVTLHLLIEAVDSNGNAAPLNVDMTTGTVYARNSSGVLISMSGQPRAPDSGLMQLVGVGKIPAASPDGTRYRNGGEQQLVIIDIKASLSFPSSTRQPSSEGGT